MAMKRRPLNGKSLLIASAGLGLLGCGTDPGSNPGISPPSPTYLCVESEPPTAEVLVDGDTLDGDGCADVGGAFSAQVTATAQGYLPFEEDVPVEPEGTTNFTVVMTEDDSTP